MAKRGEKGNSAREPKLHQVAEWRKKTLGEPRLSGYRDIAGT